MNRANYLIGKEHFYKKYGKAIVISKKGNGRTVVIVTDKSGRYHSHINNLSIV